jgi:putative hydrolase of the HAD superfamily
MPGSKPRAVIFDIGRVLVGIDLSRVSDTLTKGLSLTPKEFWTALEKDPRWQDWQCGRITPRDWHLHLNKRFGTTLTFEEFVAAWNKVLDPEPLQPTSLFEQLSRTNRLGLISNTDKIHVAYLEATYDFFRFFPVRMYSCSVGASKPDPLIYREALRGCKVQAQDAIYVDDVPAFVQAAESLGIRGIHYQSPQQLNETLTALGALQG